EARNILETYWEGESTLEEENRLKAFFRTHSRNSLPADMQQAAELFSFYENESGRIAEDLSLPEMHYEKQKQMQRLARSWWKYAAAVILLLAGVSLYLYTNQRSPKNEPVPQYTSQEQAQAFKTTKRALQLVASNLNKGKRGM